jgi:hypothetical protein
MLRVCSVAGELKTIEFAKSSWDLRDLSMMTEEATFPWELVKAFANKSGAVKHSRLRKSVRAALSDALIRSNPWTRASFRRRLIRRTPQPRR